MKKQIILILFLIVHMYSLGQDRANSIGLNNVCIDNICLGDSIEVLLEYFGKPDTIIDKPMRNSEFEEPSHKVYYYKDMRFYEVYYSEITKDLFYGFQIRKDSVKISLNNIELYIGISKVEIMREFSGSIIKKEDINEIDELYLLRVFIPDEMKDLEGSFISGIILIFCNDILKEVWTPLDKN